MYIQKPKGNETSELLTKDEKYQHKFENQHHNNVIATKYGCNLLFLQLHNQKRIKITAHHQNSKHIKIELS